MGDTSGRRQPTGAYREKLAGVLAEQLLYHEAPHHDPPNPALSRTVLPKAHTLIDIYKLLHQAEFGMGHLIRDPLSFKDLLFREFFRGGQGGNDPLMEKISPDGAGVRLNLRPFRAFFAEGRERALEVLHRVCLESAARVKGRAEGFLDSLKVFGELNGAGRLGFGSTVVVFPPRDVASFILEVERYFLENGRAPVMSHSRLYRSLNRPSYRVVVLDVVREAFPEIFPQ